MKDKSAATAAAVSTEVEYLPSPRSIEVSTADNKTHNKDNITIQHNKDKDEKEDNNHDVADGESGVKE